MIGAPPALSLDWLPAVSLGDVGIVLGALVAARTLSVALGERWRRTLGRRGELYRRLGRLGVGAQLAFFEAVIGEPPAMKSTVKGKAYEEDADGEPVEREKDYTQSIFVDRYFFLQTLSDELGTVEAFSVTTRDRRFTPTFTALPRPARKRERLWRWIRRRGETDYFFKVKLGQTKFSEIPENPVFVRAWTAVKAAAYSEGYGGGTPTLHQAFVVTTSTASEAAPGGPSLEVASALGHGEWSPGEIRPADHTEPSEASDRIEDIPSVKEFRSSTVVTTYSVLLMAPEMYPDTTFGPHGDEVQLLP